LIPWSVNGIFTRQLQNTDGSAGESFDFLVNLCSAQPECTDSTMPGDYFITELNQSIATRLQWFVQFDDVGTHCDGQQRRRVVRGRVRPAHRERGNFLRRQRRAFITALDPTTETTTFIFAYQSNVLCGNGLIPPKPTDEPDHGFYGFVLGEAGVGWILSRVAEKKQQSRRLT
jgi:hypothetical protein